MPALHAAIAAILSLPNGAPIAHLRARDPSYLPEVVIESQSAARMAGVSEVLYAFLIAAESHFDDRAVSFNGTSVGIAQLNRRSKHHRRWRAACRQAPSLCRFASLAAGAYALREAIDACGGNHAAAVRFYRAGTCSGVRRRDRHVAVLASSFSRNHQEIAMSSSYDIHVFFGRDGKPRASCTMDGPAKTKPVRLTQEQAATLADIAMLSIFAGYRTDADKIEEPSR